jgi:ABC-2 type transport system permease protein
LRARRTASIYRHLLVQSIKTLLEYKLNFIVLVAGGLLINVLSFVFVSALFRKIPAFEGWTFWEVILIYALVIFAEGVNQLFCDGVSTLSAAVYFGGVDFYLVRPLSPILQLSTAWFAPLGVGNIAFGLFLGTTALIKLDPAWSIGKAGYAVVMIAAAIVIRISVQLAVHSSGFWFRQSPMNRFAISMNGLYNFVRYPIPIYSLAVQAIVVFVVPVAFVSFFPAAFLIGKKHWEVGGLLTPLAAVYTAFLARWLFYRGLHRYESIGG